MMAVDITETLIRAFEDSYSDYTSVRFIEQDFESAGFSQQVLPEWKDWGGTKRRMAARYHTDVDFTDSGDLDRILLAWAKQLYRLEGRRDHREVLRLRNAMRLSGLDYADGSITQSPNNEPLTALAAPQSLWVPDHFRLFVTHVASFKEKATLLKEELATFNVSAFVAHEDIEPSVEWQAKIEQALEEMHALVALLSEGFHVSHWTDQEVGYALGRGVLVVPIRRDLDPYGFLGKIQAINSRGKKPATVARETVELLARHQRTKECMGEALAARLARSGGYRQSADLTSLLEVAAPLSDVANTIVERGFYANPEVHEAVDVAPRLSALLGKALDTEAA